MACAFLTLIAGALVLLIFYLTKKYTYWKRHGIPTAKGMIPVFGHLLPLITAKLNYTQFSLQAYETFKTSSMVGFYILTYPALILRDPRLVKTVLKSNFSSFHENAWKILPSLDPLLAMNPFFSDGDVWVTARKRFNYAFSNTRLKILFAPISGVCKKFEAFLDRRLKSSNKYEVELKELFSKFTGEVLANAGFGIEGFCFEDESHPMAFDKIGEQVFKPSFITAIINSIVFFLPKLNHILRVSLVPTSLDKMFRKLVEENLAVRQTETTPRSDFLQMMIELEKAQGEVDKEALTAHALSFYSDGSETSSATLSFIGYHLAVHKDVQERLREEVQSTIAKHDGQLTFEALKEMKYMDQVMNESQRRFPSLGFTRKSCTEEFVLEGSDGLSCRVKPGTEIVIPINGLHMDPEYWPDPEVFDPDRFSEDRKQNIEKMTFLPFGDGPRICIGMRIALLQMKACLATLLRNYKLELSPKTQLPFKMIPAYFVAVPVGGVWMYISKL